MGQKTRIPASRESSPSCRKPSLDPWGTMIGPKPVTLQCNASLKGLGARIIQDGQPIAFASKSLTDTETHYANIERELLAIVYGCEKFHTYLYSRTFIVETDHKPLEMISLKNLTAAPCTTPENAPLSTAVWPDHHIQARQRRCFWQMPSATSHPEPTPRSS